MTRTDARLDRLEALLGQAADGLHQAAPLLANLLGLDGDGALRRVDAHPAAAPQPHARGAGRPAAGLAARQPVLLVLEDAHWIDPTTLELIELALDRVAGQHACCC